MYSISFLLLSTIIFNIESYSFSWKSINPFRGEIKEDKPFQKEYDFDEGGEIVIENNIGNITVKGWGQKKIRLEARKKGSEDEIYYTSMSIKINNKTAYITTVAEDQDDIAEIEYYLFVPNQTTVKARTKSGKIKTEKIDAPVDLITEAGDISIDAINSVQAKSLDGSVKLKLRRLAPNGYAFIESKNDTNLYLANTLNANLRLKTLGKNSKIESDIYLTVEPITTKLNKDSWERVKRDVKATIGTGDAPVTVDVIKGNIKVEEL
jgi:hypothetical protein